MDVDMEADEFEKKLDQTKVALRNAAIATNNNLRDNPNVNANILWDDQPYEVKLDTILWCEAELRSKHIRVDFAIKGWLAREFITDLYRSRYYSNPARQKKKVSSVSKQSYYSFTLKASIMG